MEDKISVMLSENFILTQSHEQGISYISDIRHIRIQGDHNNNKIERFNGEVRDREKVMRGLKKKDTPILTGYQIFHNHVRPHMGLNGQTPAERCGIKVRING
jgi:transposase InsO family protein